MRLSLPKFFAVLLGVSGCAQFDPVILAERTADRVGLQREEIEVGAPPGGPLPIVMHVRQASTQGAPPLVVYIEGDDASAYGRAPWGANPTPIRPHALFMANSDPSPNVLHIARPCQFMPLDHQRKCQARLWTSHRYSEDVVAAMNEAINRVTLRHPTAGIRLVGHSGGGALAVLLAARRHDVIDLRTMAGILDISGLDAVGSLNPLDFAARVASVPQIHWVGGRDTIATRARLDAFVQRAGITHCTALRDLKTASHDEGWAENWPKLSVEQPRCR